MAAIMVMERAGPAHVTLLFVVTEGPPPRSSWDKVRDPTERPLIDGLRRGEPRAFDAAYAKYHARVYGFLVRLSGRRDVAEDLFQETWLRLARHATRLAEDTDLRGWLFAVARNAWVSYRRWSLLDVSRLVALDESGPARATTHDPEARADAARSLERLERALAALPVASREVLLLVGVEGFDQHEAAVILGISYEALRQRLARARALLAERLALVAAVGVEA
jgi:RNA polymerase sigma-70 factor (ECF subfamily)